MSEASQTPEVLDHVTDIVAAYVSNNTLDVAALPALIAAVHTSLTTLGTAPEPEPVAEKPKPAVPIRSSIKDDYIVCLEDGKQLRMLKRYLRTRYNLTPEEYRARWGLPADYPMVAPNYSERRSEFAKQSGLGTKGRGGGRKKR
ncbi:MAG: MucR family transcriptional regulator [Hyphomonadaceae bacterium]|jgi:predicted transcriptional regulator|nr:MucR family transcriptional regulator [Hyphomonadaceae bacterium]